MKRFITCMLLLVLSIASFALPVAADELHIVTAKDFAPYSFPFGQEIRGIDYEVFKEAAQRLGWDIRFELVPHENILEMVRSGKCDGAFSLGYDSALETDLVYARKHPMHVSSYAVFTRIADDYQYAGIESLSGKTVAVPADSQLGEEFDAAVAAGKIKRVDVKGVSESVGLLFQGRADAFVGQTVSTFHLLTKMGMSNTVIASRKPIRRDKASYAVFSRNSGLAEPERIGQLFELALESMLVDGAYRKIEARYVVR